MGETRKLAAILVSDVVGYSRLAGADEDRTLARLRGLRSDLIDPAIAAHHGRTVKRTGDGSLIEFRRVVDAVRCAIEVQSGLIERNAGVPEDRRIEFRVGIHLGDVVEEADGDLMGDGVNIAARLEGIAQPGAICLSEDAYRQVKGRLDLKVTDLGPTQLKNIAEPIRVYSLQIGVAAHAKPAPTSAEKSAAPRLSMVVLPFANIGGGAEQEHFVDGVTESLTTDLSRIRGAVVIARNTAFTYKGKPLDVKTIGRELNVRYVLEGSVQRGGNRMRVNVQLIDAEAGNHLWAERFDKPLYQQGFRLFPAVLPASPSGMPSRASRWIRPVCWWRPGANCPVAAAASGAPAQRHIARWIVMRRPLRVARERGASEGRYRPNDSKR